MAKTIQEEHWRWIKPIINKGMSLMDVANACPHNERSLKSWKKVYQLCGMKGLIHKSIKPKTQPNETPIRLQEEIKLLRKQIEFFSIKSSSTYSI